MPFDPRVKPTDDDFSRYVEQQEGVWDGAVKEAKRIDGMYFGTTNIWEDFYKRNPLVARDRPDFHPGTFAASVDQGVAAHMAFEPTFEREPVGEGEEHSAAAGRLEKGLQVVVHNSFQRAANYPTRQNGKGLMLHDYTALLVLLDTSGMVKPKRKRGEGKEDWQRREWEWMSTEQHWNPIKLVVPTMGEVLMDPLKTNPDIMVWRRKMKAYDLDDLLLRRRDRYSRLTGAALRRFADAWVGEFDMADADEDVEVEEWWSMRWHGIRLRKGSRGLLWEPNTLGIQPGLHVWGGTAISPVGEDFDVKWWVQQSMVHKVIDEVIMDAQATAGHHEVLQKGAFPPLVTPLDAGEAAEQIEKRILQGKADEWAWLRGPELPAQTFVHKQNLEQAIERHTFPNMVAGLRQSEAETATGMVILSENTERTFKSAVSKMEHLYSGMGSHILKSVYRMTQEYGDDFGEVGTGKQKLRVKDMGDPPQFHVRARFQQVNAVVEMQSRQQDLVLLEKGLISSDYFYAQHGFEDPDGMRKEIYADLMRKDPMYVAQGLINAFREARMHEVADQMQGQLDMAMAQRLMGQGQMQPGGGGQPGGMPQAGGGAPVQPPPMRPMIGNGRPVRRMP